MFDRSVRCGIVCLRYVKGPVFADVGRSEFGKSVKDEFRSNGSCGEKRRSEGRITGSGCCGVKCEHSGWAVVVGGTHELA